MKDAGAMAPQRPGESTTQPGAPGGDSAAASDPLTEIAAVLAQARGALADACAATLDAWRGALRRALLSLLALVLAAAVAAATVVVGVVFLLMGVAGGTAAALGCPLWAGYLAVGAAGALLPGLSVHIWSRTARSRRLMLLRAKYVGRLARRAAH